MELDLELNSPTGHSLRFALQFSPFTGFMLGDLSALFGGGSDLDEVEELEVEELDDPDDTDTLRSGASAA